MEQIGVCQSQRCSKRVNSVTVITVTARRGRQKLSTAGSAKPIFNYYVAVTLNLPKGINGDLVRKENACNNLDC